METNFKTSKQEINITLMYLVIAALMLVTFSSCTMEKRLYRPGVHVDFKKSHVKAETNSSPQTTNVTTTPPETKHQETIEDHTNTLQDPEPTNDVASTSPTILPKKIASTENNIPSKSSTEINDPKSKKSTQSKEDRLIKKKKIAVSILSTLLSLAFNFLGLWVLSLVLAGIMAALAISAFCAKSRPVTINEPVKKEVDYIVKEDTRSAHPAGSLALLGLFIVLAFVVISLLICFTAIIGITAY